MFIPFDQLPAHSRIWIYQANRTISPDEQKTIAATLASFCQQWSAHDKPLQSSFKLFYNRFAVVSVDEHVNKPGGCAIGDSIKTLKVMEKELNIDFLGRTKIACWIRGEIITYSVKQVKALVATKKLSVDTLMFNNLITKKEELQKKWRIPIASSWIVRSLSPISTNYDIRPA